VAKSVAPMAPPPPAAAPAAAAPAPMPAVTPGSAEPSMP
jgi:hypothetical protein